MLLSIIILIFIYLIIYLLRWKSYKGIDLLIRNLNYIYICLVLFLTILPIDWTLDPKWNYHSSIGFSYGNVKPFNDLLLGRSGSIKEVILNIIMTIPFGFLYSMLKKNIKLITVIIGTFLFSLSIELTQLIMTIFLIRYRSFDVTDLMTNTIGGFVGYLIYRKISRLNVKRL